jgi:hypothetical protein
LLVEKTNGGFEREEPLWQICWHDRFSFPSVGNLFGGFDQRAGRTVQFIQVTLLRFQSGADEFDFAGGGPAGLKNDLQESASVILRSHLAEPLLDFTDLRFKFLRMFAHTISSFSRPKLWANLEFRAWPEFRARNRLKIPLKFNEHKPSEDVKRTLRLRR